MRKKNYLTGVLGAFLILSVSVMHAEDMLKLPDTKLEVGINRSGREAATAVLKFPLLARQPGKIPVLKAKFFFEADKTGGGNYSILLFLNVHKMSVQTYQGKQRLLRLSPPTNKRGLLPNGQRAKWYSPSGWFVMSGRGSGPIDKNILSTADGGWTYYFDISDLVKYTDTESEIKENHLQVACRFQARKRVVKFQEMEIIYLPESEADAKRKQ